MAKEDDVLKAVRAVHQLMEAGCGGGFEKATVDVERLGIQFSVGGPRDVEIFQL
jgi:hypothetical protein